MMRRRHVFRLLPAAALCGCGQQPRPVAPEMPKVPWRVTSTTQFTANIVSIIGGKAVDSRCIVPVEVSPHAFIPAVPDLAKFDTSDVVIAHGLGLESRWPVDLAALDKGGVRVFTVSDGIAPESILRSPGPAGSPDPHIWNDHDLALHMVNAVENALKTSVPKLTDYFAPRAHTLRLQFRDARAYATAKLKSLKPTDRFLLTSHDTMQYFAKANGLEAKALCPAGGQVPATLPDDLLTWIRTHQVTSLFREPFTDVVALRTLLRDPGVDPDHIIYSLTLAKEGTTGTVSIKDYDVATAAGALRYNADIIIARLEVD